MNLWRTSCANWSRPAIMDKTPDVFEPPEVARVAVNRAQDLYIAARLAQVSDRRVASMVVDAWAAEIAAVADELIAVNDEYAAGREHVIDSIAKVDGAHDALSRFAAGRRYLRVLGLSAPEVTAEDPDLTNEATAVSPEAEHVWRNVRALMTTASTVMDHAGSDNTRLLAEHFVTPLLGAAGGLLMLSDRETLEFFGTNETARTLLREHEGFVRDALLPMLGDSAALLRFEDTTGQEAAERSSGLPGVGE